MTKWAYLTVEVPRSVAEEYFPKFPPVRVELSDSDIRLEMRANGRPARVPAGILNLWTSARGRRPATTTVELREGESRVYRFTEQQFRTVRPKRFTIAGRGNELPGTAGAFFLRFLEGPNRRRVDAGYIVTRTADGGLTVTFSREPARPLVADVMVPGHSRALIALGTKASSCLGYSSARLVVERQTSTAAIGADQTDPELSLARHFAAIGNLPEAVRLVGPYLAKYTKGEPFDDMEAAGVAYILIRSGEVGQLYPWALRLLESKYTAADGMVIAAEWFAHAGCHLTALNLLRQMSETDSPIFTDGYSLATARLAAYGAGWLDPRDRDNVSSGPGRGLDLDEKLAAMFEKEERAGMAPLLGQQLRQWDCLQARVAHQRITRGIEQVDWSAYLVRLVPRRNQGWPNALQTAFEWLQTRLTGDWIRIAWSMPRADCA